MSQEGPLKKTVERVRETMESVLGDFKDTRRELRQTAQSVAPKPVRELIRRRVDDILNTKRRRRK